MAEGGDDDAAAELASVPDLPAAAAYLWKHFADLSRSRRYGAMGDPLPISYGDIGSWSTVTGERLAPWELQAVIALDAAFMTAQRPEEGEAREEA